MIPLRALADAALSTLFAPPCASCGAALPRPFDGAVCEGCWASIHRITPPSCDGCGDPLPSWHEAALAAGRCTRCRPTEGPVARARAVGAYEGTLREIVHALKYQGRRSVVPPLQRLMRDAGEELLARADALVPVPLHPRREWTRGFNQAALLADGLGPPVVPLLRRVVHTPPQVDLPAAERHRNVRDAFALRHAAPRLQGPLAGTRAAVGLPARVVLIDDVTTTGATLDACARALKSGGVCEVWALTAARVVSARP